MKIGHITRLQGLEWTNYKRTNKLHLLAIGKSSNGNYVSYTIDKCNHVVRHWLGASEVQKLEQSDWIKTNKIWDSNDLYSHKTLCNLKKELKNYLQTIKNAI